MRSVRHRTQPERALHARCGHAAKRACAAGVSRASAGRDEFTLKHGDIKNLDMPGMTMVFRVKDATMLDQVKEGDKIKFTADKIGGQFTVTGIETKR